ncbi:MAG TPA: glycosyltransferase [Gaiellaceae bacterium]|nr:glycosyltransferase [Gaiellaceae bacterium]
MRILLVSQMYPSAAAPDFGVFVQGLERELAERGHTFERVVIDRRGGGKLRHARLALRAVRTARRFRPDVVYAHFLFPTGLGALFAARACGAPLVVTAHGQDVANATEYPFVRPFVRRVVRGASGVIAVSDWLRARLEQSAPEARGKTEVIDCGVDLGRFRPLERTGAAGPAFVCVGSLIERKNVVRLADAFARLGEGTLTFVGDGPLRARLAGRPGVTVTGYVAHDAVPGYLAAADVLCQPSLVEPFGQATLEAMACGRTVVATRVGGPPEFVPPEAGVLVDPADEAALVEALRAAAALPVPNPAARAAAEQHDVRLQAARVEAILVEAVLERASRDRRA